MNLLRTQELLLRESLREDSAHGEFPTVVPLLFCRDVSSDYHKKHTLSAMKLQRQLGHTNETNRFE